jgi:hypothetical protein
MAWMELMRITSLVKKIRDLAHLEFTRVGDFGFPERHEEGEAIQLKLLEWELSLPASFTPVEPPVPLELLDMPILKLVQPVFYANTNIAIAMGILFLGGLRRSTLRSVENQRIQWHA